MTTSKDNAEVVAFGRMTPDEFKAMKTVNEKAKHTQAYMTQTNHWYQATLALAAVQGIFWFVILAYGAYWWAKDKK